MTTGLSPEWDRWFDEAFTDLITNDEDLVQAEFGALIGASWRQPSPDDSRSPRGGPPLRHAADHRPGDEDAAQRREGPHGDQRRDQQPGER